MFSHLYVHHLVRINKKKTKITSLNVSEDNCEANTLLESVSFTQ